MGMSPLQWRHYPIVLHSVLAPVHYRQVLLHAGRGAYVLVAINTVRPAAAAVAFCLGDGPAIWVMNVLRVHVPRGDGPHQSETCRLEHEQRVWRRPFPLISKDLPVPIS